MLIRANKHIVGEKRKDGPPSRKDTAGEPNEWRILSPEEGKKPTLIDEQIFELAELVLKIESHYGFPVDVEWACEKGLPAQAGKFYITQSRPITTLSSTSRIL